MERRMYGGAGDQIGEDRARQGNALSSRQPLAPVCQEVYSFLGFVIDQT